jgi:hypothetical protein
MRDCVWRTQEPHKTHPALLDIALPALEETLRPWRGERQERKRPSRTSQMAWISRPSSSTGTRTTSRMGGGFSSSGGLRPSSARMRFTEILSLMYATIFGFPPHCRQASGSAWYSLLISLAQLGGQRRLVLGSAGISSDAFHHLRALPEARGQAVGAGHAPRDDSVNASTGCITIVDTHDRPCQRIA